MTKSWLLVLHVIGWESGAGLLGQEKQNQCNLGILSTPDWKLLEITITNQSWGTFIQNLSKAQSQVRELNVKKNFELIQRNFSTHLEFARRSIHSEEWQPPAHQEEQGTNASSHSWRVQGLECRTSGGSCTVLNRPVTSSESRRQHCDHCSDKHQSLPLPEEGLQKIMNNSTFLNELNKSKLPLVSSSFRQRHANFA